RRIGINFALLANGKILHIRFAVDCGLESTRVGWLFRNGHKLFNSCLVATVRICINMRNLQLVKL
ncbi:unnamed protein product, partial [Prunus brigantina]